MADIVKQQIRKFEQIAKPYLYEGPFQSQWGFIEGKIPLKRAQIALGNLSSLPLQHIFILFDRISSPWCRNLILSIWMGQ